MNTYEFPAAFKRNQGWVSGAEQECLANSTVVIAGAGGDGGALAEQLVRFGVGELRLADPDTFGEENINRQAFCTAETVGRNKAEVVAEGLRAIHPRLKVTTYSEGVTPDNLEDFMTGADLLADESDFTRPEVGVMLARDARERGVPNVMALNVGFGGLVTTYHQKGKTLEAVLGLDPAMPLDEIAEQRVSILRWLTTIPSYAHLDVFKRVSSENDSMGLDTSALEAPTVVQGVALAAGTAATEAALNLWHAQGAKGVPKRRKPVYAPHVISIDAMDLRTKVIKHPRLSTNYALARMVLRSKLGRNPEAM